MAKQTAKAVTKWTAGEAFREALGETPGEARRWEIAVLVPLVILLGLAFVFWHAEGAIYEAQLEGKRVEIWNEVNMLAAGMDANPGKAWHEHESNLQAMVAYLDSQPLTFAAAYRPSVRGPQLITNRDNATNFDPLSEPLFLAEMEAADMQRKSFGWVSIGFTPDIGATAGVYRDMHVYWRRMPVYAEPDQQYLVVSAVSKHSVSVQIAQWIRITPLISIVVTFMLNIWVAVMLIRLGIVWGDREGEKWRAGEGRR
jgi:hypothetical protein